MAASKKVRWECPEGVHMGAMGATRPRRENIVRYCLDCSKREGRLVERVAPALTKKREVQAASAEAKRKALAARVKAREDAKHAIAGIDVRVEMRRLARLKCFDGKFKRRGLPELTITRRSYMPSRLGAASPWEWRIWLTDYRGIDSADIRETLLHEMVHLYLGGCSTDKLRWHGPSFHSKLSEAFVEAYGCRPYAAKKTACHGRYAGALRVHELTPDGKRALVAELYARADAFGLELTEGTSKPSNLVEQPEEIRRRAQHYEGLAGKQGRAAR